MGWPFLLPPWLYTPQAAHYNAAHACQRNQRETRMRSRYIALLRLLLLGAVLTYALLGWHMRPVLDDFCPLYRTQEGGIAGSVSYYGTETPAAYTTFALHSALYRLLDIYSPAVVPTLILIAGIGAFFFLLRELRHAFNVGLSRRALLLLAFASTVSFIYGMYTPNTFLFQIASIPYSLSLMGFTAYLGYVLWWVRRQPSLRPLAWQGHLVLSMVLIGISANFFINHAVYMLTFLAFLWIGAALFSGKEQKRRALLILGLGVLMVLLNLGIALVGPGFEQSIEHYDPPDWENISVRALPIMVSRVLFTGLLYLGLENTWLALGFVFMLVALLRFWEFQPDERYQLRARLRFSYLLPVVWLVVHVSFISYLWNQSSNNPVVLGRYSYSYAAILAFNGVMIALGVLMLLVQGLIQRWINNRPSYWVVVHTSLLPVLLLGGAVLTLIDIAPRGIQYLGVTWMLLFIGANVSLLHLIEAPVRLGRWLLFMLLMGYMLMMSTLPALLFARGFIERRHLVTNVFTVLLLAIVLGYFAGTALKVWAQRSSVGARWTRRMAQGAQAVTLLLAAGLLLLNVALLPNYQRFVDEWHERDALLRAQAAQGATELDYYYLTTGLLDHNQPFNVPLGIYCGPAYYLGSEEVSQAP